MQEVVIGNKSGDSFSVLPTRGALISSLILNNEPVIKYPLFDNEPLKGFPSALLFPFPNRIRDGKYHFEGVDYQLNRNEIGRGHSIHGFISDETFEVTEQKRNSVTLRYSYHGGKEGYPFPFNFEVTYSIVRKHTFKLRYNIVNTGNKNMPCAFGWHPYFSFKDKKVGDLEVTIPPHHSFDVDDSTIPFHVNNVISQEPNESKVFSLKNEILDNVFKIETKNKFVETFLTDGTSELSIKQQTGKGMLNFIVLYTPPSRSSIAIEPQTANINAFNNEDGLSILPPEKALKGYIEVSFGAKHS